MFVKTHSHDGEGKAVFPDYLFGFQPAAADGQPLMFRPPSLIPATPVKNKADPDPAEAAKAEMWINCGTMFTMSWKRELYVITI